MVFRGEVRKIGNLERYIVKNLTKHNADSHVIDDVRKTGDIVLQKCFKVLKTLDFKVF